MPCILVFVAPLAVGGGGGRGNGPNGAQEGPRVPFQGASPPDLHLVGLRPGYGPAIHSGPRFRSIQCHLEIHPGRTGQKRFMLLKYVHCSGKVAPCTLKKTLLEMSQSPVKTYTEKNGFRSKIHKFTIDSFDR